MRRMPTLLCALLLSSTVLWGMTADELVQKTGIAGGLCSFPRATPADETLALELAKRPSFVVHVIARDAQAAARIRDAADAAGLLGRSFYVEQGDPAPLPFANRLVDVLVASDLRDADLTPELKREWLRVLAPQRGAALVGRAKEAGDGLSQKALKAWSGDVPKAKLLDEKSGVWAVLKAELPAGSDSWTHRCHGPENAQVSSDSTLKAPFLTQWWGMPRQEGFWGTTVVAGNGRMFSLRGSRHSGEQVFLTARSLTSGLPLWQKRVRQAPETERVPHGGYIPGRSCLVVDGDALDLIERDGVVRLDAETGQERGRIAGPKPDGQIKWIASSDGVLAVLAGDADVIKPIAYQTIAANPTGRDLAVYDAEAKKELWHDTAAGDIDERQIVARGGRLYCLVQGVGLVCRELRTGKTLWTNPDPEIQAEYLTPTPKVVDQLLASQPALMAFEEVLLFRAKWAKDLFALSRADGSLLWKKPSAGGSYRTLTAVAVDGLWVGGPGGTIDLKTGQPAKGPRFVSSGCGPTTSVPGYLITCFGTVMETQSNRVIRTDDIKSPCDVGSLVSEGMMVTVPSECGCSYEVKGYRALTSAGDVQPHTAPAWQGRLTVLDTTEPKPLAVTVADWPTYRHDARRSGASPVTVGAASNVLWRWSPSGVASYTNKAPAGQGLRLAPDDMVSAPVAAAGRVWFASHDGVIHCLESATGKEQWKYATGSMVFAPPTIWEGRVLVGGGDGRVHCLDATTGRCLWRLLAGPADRRVFWYGHLISTWPVIPGIVVQDGVGYAVAGYQKENGIHAYAFDPKNGKVIWEKDEAGSGGAGGPGAGLGNGGGMAVAGGRIWLASAPAGGFDLKTGDWKSYGGGHFGCEVGVLDKWVLQGGRRLSETQDTLVRPLGASGFSAFSPDPEAGRAGLNDTGTSLPAWDAELVLMPPKGLTGSLAAVPMAQWTGWLSGLPAAQAAAKAANATVKPKLPDWADLKTWTTEAGMPAAYALAKDQAVVVHSDGRTHKVSGYLRTDGSKAWTAELPDQPAMNRLALDADGRVLVSLANGSLVCLGR